MNLTSAISQHFADMTFNYRANSTQEAGSNGFSRISFPYPRNLLASLLVLIGAWIIYKVVNGILFTVRVRTSYKDIPSAPRHWLFGNLKLLGEKCNPNKPHHPDYGIEWIWNSINQPPMFLLDIAPVSTPILVIADPAIAEEIAQPSAKYKYSVLKTDSAGDLTPLVGKDSMITAEGELWRSLRKRFNKGFSPSHLCSLSPLVMSKAKIFLDRLRNAAETGEVFAMKELAQDLTTDIITMIAIEEDFESQSLPEGVGHKGPFGFLTASRKLSGLVYKSGQGFSLYNVLNIARPMKAWLYETIQNRALDNIIRRKLKAEASSTTTTKSDTKKSKAKAIVQLALEGLQPTNALIHNTRDQIKSFLFAGQDTTATAIQWICYELSQAAHSPSHAAMLTKLQAEHDTVFGPNPTDIFSTLSSPSTAEQILGDKLPYTTAFIKETLRIHPPASTARCSPYIRNDAQPYYIHLAGQPVRVDGVRFYIMHWLLHRSKAIWGPDALVFRPERWLDDAYMRTIPTGAYRPFERGPRNCIGQELATVELKIVLCVVVRMCVFEKVGLTGRDGELEVYNKHEVTAVPVDGMMMRVKMRGEGGD